MNIYLFTAKSTVDEEKRWANTVYKPKDAKDRLIGSAIILQQNFNGMMVYIKKHSGSKGELGCFHRRVIR
jgi:hypothetical protein